MGAAHGHPRDPALAKLVNAAGGTAATDAPDAATASSSACRGHGDAHVWDAATPWCCLLPSPFTIPQPRSGTPQPGTAGGGPGVPIRHCYPPGRGPRCGDPRGLSPEQAAPQPCRGEEGEQGQPHGGTPGSWQLAGGSDAQGPPPGQAPTRPRLCSRRSRPGCRGKSQPAVPCLSFPRQAVTPALGCEPSTDASAGTIAVIIPGKRPSPRP